MNTMDVLSKLIDAGAAIAIEPEGDDGPGCVTITDGTWRCSRSLVHGAEDLPLEFDRAVAVWQEHSAAK